MKSNVKIILDFKLVLKMFFLHKMNTFAWTGTSTRI